MTLTETKHVQAMARTLQPHLDLRDARWLPCVAVNGAMWSLGRDYSAHDVLVLLEQHYLRGLSIGAGGTGDSEGRRREVRIFTKSIEHFKETAGRVQFEITDDEVLKLMCPHTKPVILGTEMQTALNCDSKTVINLVSAGHLRIVPGATWERGTKRGPTASPPITRESYAAFLKARLL